MRKLKPLKILKVILVLLLVFCLLYRYISIPKTTNQIYHDKSKIEIHLINVEQSEAILIIQGNHTMLIDTGEMFYGQTIADYIYDMGIKKIDVLVITHFHKDHVGGTHRIISSFNIEKIICMDSKYISTLQERFWYTDLRVAKRINEICKGINIKLESPYNDNGKLKELPLGEAKVNFLLQKTDTNIVNNKSIVTRITFDDFSILFMADSEMDVEQELIKSNIDLSADVLKVGHHGSNTSSTMEFLEKVNPKYVIISCGKNNIYSHPHKQVLERLNNLNIRTYRTNLNGSIILKSDKHCRIEIITER